MSTKRAKATAKPQRRQQPQQPARKLPVLPIVFVVLAGALVAAILFTGGESQSDSERVAEAAGTVSITGTNLDLYRDGLDPGVGSVAPTVTGEDYAGNSVSIEHDGTPKAILFLAHWCSHCQAEVPRVQEWLNATGGVAGVDILSVSTSYQPASGNWSPEDWLERENWTVPVIRDDADSSALVAYGAGPFPYWVLLRGDGSVALRTSGERSITEVEAMLVALRDA
jgi:thiol-disulfide isomerase/thioredoxin